MPEDLPDVYLRFEDFKGECNDTKHRGDEGWITIKSFSFGFGEKGASGKDDKDHHGLTDQEWNSILDHSKKPPTPDKAKLKALLAQKAAKHNGNTKNPSPEKGKKDKSEGPLDPDPINFSKSSDIMSSSLMQACHKGTKIPKVVLHACRQGGPKGAEKLVFLKLTFEVVHLKTCVLNLVTDGLPTETYTFDYEKVTVGTLWTDNATGAARQAKPISVAFSRSDLSIDEPSPTDED